jgi:hypothetical protein
MAEHVITVVQVKRFWFGAVAYRAQCSCGKYRSRRKYGYPGHATAAGLAHARAMRERG